MLVGNLVAILASGLVCIVVSLIKPDNYDWKSTREITMVDDAETGGSCALSPFCATACSSSSSCGDSSTCLPDHVAHQADAPLTGNRHAEYSSSECGAARGL